MHCILIMYESSLAADFPSGIKERGQSSRPLSAHSLQPESHPAMQQPANSIGRPGHSPQAFVMPCSLDRKLGDPKRGRQNPTIPRGLHACWEPTSESECHRQPATLFALLHLFFLGTKMREKIPDWKKGPGVRELASHKRPPPLDELRLRESEKLGLRAHATGSSTCLQRGGLVLCRLLPGLRCGFCNNSTRH